MDRTHQTLNISNGRYTLREFLGDGRFAVVYRALDARLQRPVAMKLLREEHIDGDPKWREAFDIEVELLQALQDQPAVVTMTDHGTTPDGRYYIGLELLPPGTDLLSRVTREGGFSEAEGLPIVWQLTDVLRTAHARNIAYRDLKLEHIFWSGEQMTLIDWNVSRMLASDKPEDDPMLQWERERSFQSDLFKLGTMLYSVFTGLDIRNREVPTPVYSQLQDSGFEVTDEGLVWPIEFAGAPLSPELKDLILRLVHIDLDERYESADAVCTALEEHAERLGIMLAKPAPAPPVQQSLPASDGFQELATVSPLPEWGEHVNDWLEQLRAWWHELRR